MLTTPKAKQDDTLAFSKFKTIDNINTTQTSCTDLRCFRFVCVFDFCFVLLLLFLLFFI